MPVNEPHGRISPISYRRTRQGRHPQRSGRSGNQGAGRGDLNGYNRNSKKPSSKKEWKLSDSLRDKITEYAREDAAQNVYMGNKFLALRKSEVAKVAPDRSALMGKLNQDMADMKTIREADERRLRLLFGEPYEAKFQSGGVHVYDGNGDEILTYTVGVGGLA